jgi:hypothetical protein
MSAQDAAGSAAAQSPSIPAGHEDALVGPVASEDARRRAACCCGRESCAFLRHNDEVLDVLERDVRTAAQLGQVRLGDIRLELDHCGCFLLLRVFFVTLSCPLCHVQLCEGNCTLFFFLVSGLGDTEVESV